MSIYAEKRVPYKIQCLHEPARVTLLPTKKLTTTRRAAHFLYFSNSIVLF